MTTVGLHLPLDAQWLFQKMQWQLLACLKPESKLMFTCLGRDVPVHSTLSIFPGKLYFNFFLRKTAHWHLTKKVSFLIKTWNLCWLVKFHPRSFTYLLLVLTRKIWISYFLSKGVRERGGSIEFSHLLGEDSNPDWVTLYVTMAYSLKLLKYQFLHL